MPLDPLASRTGSESSQMLTPTSARPSTPTASPNLPSSQSSPFRHRYEVEMYAHALKARLELASFKAANGWVMANIDDLEKHVSSPPSTPSLTSVDTIHPSQATIPRHWQPDMAPESSKPQASTSSSTKTVATTTLHSDPSRSPSSSSVAPSQPKSAASARTPKLGSSSQPRSLYADIFGRNFEPTNKSTSAPPPQSSPCKGAKPPAPQPASSPSRFANASLLLEKVASSPQLGSPERKNGRFDWHNNPTPEMIAREDRLASTLMAPSPSPTKRKRHESASSVSSALLASPRRRSRLNSGLGTQSTPSFLPNGHPASSLAQGLGITAAPRTPRAKHAVVLQQTEDFYQDQEERDRVASTLASMAELRSTGAVTPPSNGKFANPNTITPVRANAYWTGLAKTDHPEGGTRRAAEVPKEQLKEEDEGAAQYLLFLASSPSPAGTSKSKSRFTGPAHQLADAASPRPARRSLFHDCLGSSLPTAATSPTRSRTVGSTLSARTEREAKALQSAAAAAPAATIHAPQSSPGARVASPPITPPPSSCKSSRSERRSNEGNSSDSNSSPRTPAKGLSGFAHPAVVVVATPSGNFDHPSQGIPAPKTPPPHFPHTPKAPGSDFSYAEYVNVSPSPQPSSMRRTNGRGPPIHGSGSDRTPSRTGISRARFLDYGEEWKDTELIPGPSPDFGGGGGNASRRVWSSLNRPASQERHTSAAELASPALVSSSSVITGLGIGNMDQGGGGVHHEPLTRL
ncbi:hypothetical protein IE53DRAFT_388251 [Violaceomyces palustris]|uniref:Uncharacterized protein n=1 Tax=Violaceomyces palustris TaxID=1673888 RepID=A0ACD0NUK7_9BASI|nr:hypothetical protein IE53DRAFT_388251 [Violaceomyces palustris]